jgi:hypothetical protein
VNGGEKLGGMAFAQPIDREGGDGMTRTIAILVVLFGCGLTATARAEKTNNCKI